MNIRLSSVLFIPKVEYTPYKTKTNFTYITLYTIFLWFNIVLVCFSVAVTKSNLGKGLSGSHLRLLHRGKPEEELKAGTEAET